MQRNVSASEALSFHATSLPRRFAGWLLFRLVWLYPPPYQPEPANPTETLRGSGESIDIEKDLDLDDNSATGTDKLTNS